METYDTLPNDNAVILLGIKRPYNFCAPGMGNTLIPISWEQSDCFAITRNNINQLMASMNNYRERYESVEKLLLPLQNEAFIATMSEELFFLYLAEPAKLIGIDPLLLRASPKFK